MHSKQRVIKNIEVNINRQLWTQFEQDLSLNWPGLPWNWLLGKQVNDDSFDMRVALAYAC